MRSWWLKRKGEYRTDDVNGISAMVCMKRKPYCFVDVNVYRFASLHLLATRWIQIQLSPRDGLLLLHPSIFVGYVSDEVGVYIGKRVAEGLLDAMGEK